MKIPCKVIRDLLPLYHDEVCSAESRQLVEEHLEQCEACRSELRTMEERLHVRPAQPGEEDAANAASKAWKKGTRRAFRKGAALAAAVLLAVLLLAAGGFLYVRNMPVERDAGACGGGYATFIFDKYSQELTRKFVSGSMDEASIISADAVRGTQEASWEGRTIFLEFDIRYEHAERGTVTERVHFVGQRVWFDTYDWSGAIIEG